MFFCEEIHGKTLAFFYLVFLFDIPDIVGTKKYHDILIKNIVI